MCDNDNKMEEVDTELTNGEDTVELKQESAPNNVSNILPDEFVNDENVDALSMLNLKSKLNDVTSLADELKKNNNKLLSDNEEADFIDSKLEGVTEEDLKAMSDSEIDSFFTSDDVTVQFRIDFENPQQEKNFKRDFLIYRVQSNKALSDLDNEIAKIKDEIAASQKEFDEIIDSYGNVNNWIRTTIDDKLNSTDDEKKKALYMDIRDNFEYAFNLNNVKEYLNTHRGKCVIPDYGIEKKSMDIYKRYVKVMKRMKVREDLSKFADVEKKFIGDEYAQRSNIFMFSIMHFISSHYRDEDLSAFGLFVTQFIINMKNLVLNKFEDENEKELFISSIKEVIDIIG